MHIIDVLGRRMLGPQFNLYCDQLMHRIVQKRE